MSLLRAQVAESLLGAIDWTIPGVKGFCRCPGADLHTKKNAKTDCEVFLDNISTIFCLHTSCAGPLATTNHNLRSKIWHAERGTEPGSLKPRKLTAEERSKLDESKAVSDRAKSLQRRAALALPDIFQKFPLDPADLWESSPVRLMDAPNNDWRLLLSLFQPDDWIWIGKDPYQSKEPHHAFNFRPVEEWLLLDKAPGAFTTASTFKPDSFSRCNSNVVARRFLVYESDNLSKPDCCAVFRWAQQFLRLRAVVDTGGKSLHGWFDLPSDELLTELSKVLPVLGGDRQVLRISQPVRLPGYPRIDKGTTQALLYFDP